jgi:Family of unknown function (DUF6157)
MSKIASNVDIKLHSTNYSDAFIEIAEDCPTSIGVIPPKKENANTVASIQFELISKNPYKFTSDDVLFQVFADRNALAKNEYKEAREKYFSKGQPCFRASPLTKRYGWGVHNDKDGKIAIYGAETAEYQKFINDKNTKIIKAMKSAR